MNIKEFEKYWWVARTSAISSWAYMGDAIGRVLFFTILIYIFLCLWKTTYGETGSTNLGGLSINQMLWYLTISEAIMLSGPRTSTQIDEEVRTGAIAAHLLRPMSYALYRLFFTLGERTTRFIVNIVCGSVIAFVLVGPLNNPATAVATLILTVPLAFVIDFLALFLVGLGAFWLEDTNGIYLLYSRGVLILGGTLIPLSLYPSAIQSALKWLPFANITAGPAHLFVEPSWAELGFLLSHQLVAALALGLIVYAVYKHALKRVFVNGG